MSLSLQSIVEEQNRRRATCIYSYKMSNRKDFPSADEAKARAQKGKDTLVSKLQDDGV